MSDSVSKRSNASANLPLRFARLVDNALLAIVNSDEQAELRSVAFAVAAAAWDGWIGKRPVEDNRLEHEFVVFENVMRIAAGEGLSLGEKRVAAAFAFFHDSIFLRRITEREIRAAPTAEERTRLESQKANQRTLHMQQGADTALQLLPKLRHPNHPEQSLFSQEAIERCAGIIREHDSWKLRIPKPAGSDRLAVVCLEADALWPLHPLGVLADVERRQDFTHLLFADESAVWREQLQQSIATLIEFRSNWAGDASETFMDDDSIFRTPTGHQLYRQWRLFWNV